MAKKISYHQALTMQALGIKVTPRVYPDNHVISFKADRGIETILLAKPVKQVDAEGFVFRSDDVILCDYLKSIKWLRV